MPARANTGAHRDRRLRYPAALWVAVLATLSASVAAAQTPALEARDAWIRATPGAEVAAAYLTLRNRGPVAVVVRGVRSPLAGSAMIHESHLANGVSSMRPREPLSIAPGATVQFAPGGLHVMLQGLSHPLAPGDAVPLILILGDGAELAVTARVRRLTEP